MEETTYLESSIWLEEPEPNNDFACRAAYCHGYDVYGEMVGNAGWADMIYLLFRGEAPARSQRDALQILAVALANPGPRSASVHAAMCAGVGGAPAAAALTAALAVGAGTAGGAREVFYAVQAWAECGTTLGAWRNRWATRSEQGTELLDAWPTPEHAVGFDPLGVSTPTPVKQVLACLAALADDSRCAWLLSNLSSLEQAAGHPLSMVGVAAAAFADLGMLPEEAEMLFLLLRLPGAAAHALEQRRLGHKRFPFYSIDLESATSGVGE